MKFLVDMPLSRGLAEWLAARGHDAKHASHLGLDRAPDTEILTRAKQEMRTVITADLDYPRLLALAQSSEPSLILFRDGNWSEAEIVARMTDVLGGLTEEEIVRSIIVIEKDRVRRRRLPLGA